MRRAAPDDGQLSLDTVKAQLQLGIGTGQNLTGWMRWWEILETFQLDAAVIGAIDHPVVVKLNVGHGNAERQFCTTARTVTGVKVQVSRQG